MAHDDADTSPPVHIAPVRLRSREAARMLSMDWEEMKQIPFEQLPYSRKKRNRYYFVDDLREYARREAEAARKQGDDPANFRLSIGGADD